MELFVLNPSSLNFPVLSKYPSVFLFEELTTFYLLYLFVFMYEYELDFEFSLSLTYALTPLLTHLFTSLRLVSFRFSW